MLLACRSESHCSLQTLLVCLRERNEHRLCTLGNLSELAAVQDSEMNTLSIYAYLFYTKLLIPAPQSLPSKVSDY